MKIRNSLPHYRMGLSGEIKYYRNLKTKNDLIMTRNQFIHYSYRHSEIIIWHQKHPEVDIECMLIGVDFDHELFHLVPIDLDYYEDRSYWLPYTSCDKQFKKPKMKVVRGDRTIVTK